MTEYFNSNKNENEPIPSVSVMKAVQGRGFSQPTGTVCKYQDKFLNFGFSRPENCPAL